MSSKTANTVASSDRDNIGIIWLLPAGKHSTGIVSVTYMGQPITVDFHAAKMEVILLLNELRTSDGEENVPPEPHRWHSYKELIPRLSDPLQLVETLRRKVCDINRDFRIAAEEALPGIPVPRLIDTKRDFGVHLNWRFRVLFRKHSSSVS